MIWKNVKMNLKYTKNSLELKILKEKVVDDEKKSGIGSLFDDEKTSH
jgi:hypothetical protein